MKNIIFISVVIITLTLNTFAQVNKESSSFLDVGKFINSDQPKIIAKALELTANCSNNVEKAKALFEFVRDSYNDNIFDSYVASDVLKNGGNLCYQRAPLLAALNRAAGIPSRLHLQRVTIKRKKGDIVFAHAVTGTYLNGKWLLYEATGNRGKWIDLTGDEKQAQKMTVEFFPDRDCLFKSTEKVIFENIPGVYEDWTDKMIEAVKKIDGGRYLNMEQFKKNR